jgi:hypothetical protein
MSFADDLLIPSMFTVLAAVPAEPRRAALKRLQDSLVAKLPGNNAALYIWSCLAVLRHADDASLAAAANSLCEAPDASLDNLEFDTLARAARGAFGPAFRKHAESCASVVLVQLGLTRYHAP